MRKICNNSDGSVSVFLTPEEQAPGMFNSLMMATGGLVDDGDIIDGPGNSIVGLQLDNQSYMSAFPTSFSQTDTELIQDMMDKIRMLEATIMEMTARIRGLNAQVLQLGSLIINKAIGLSATRAFLETEVEVEQEQQPKRKFRPIEMEA